MNEVSDAIDPVVQQTVPADMPDLNSLEETAEGVDLPGAEHHPDTLVPPPEVIPEPHVARRDEEPEARLLSASASSLYVSPEPLLEGVVVPRADTCWADPGLHAIRKNCYIVGGSRRGENGAVVLCDYYEPCGPNGELVIREVLVHGEHFNNGNLCPFNRRPSWTQSGGLRMPAEQPQIPEQAQPPADAPAIDGTIEQLAIELGQSPAQVQRLVNGAVQGLLAFVQTKGVIETSPVLGAFVEQIRSSPIVDAFRELLGLKQIEKAVGAEQIGNDANVQQIVEYINKTLEPKVDALERELAALKQAPAEVPPKGERSEFDDDEDDVVDVDEEDDEEDLDDLDDDVDIDEPEIAEPEPGPPPRSSKPPAPPKASPGRPKGASDKKPRRISTRGRKPAKKAASKVSLGPSGRAKAKGRRGPSIAAKKAASKALALPKVDSKTASIDGFLKGAENVKVRRMLKSLPEAKLNQFIAAAKKGIPDFALTTWKVRDQADFFGWFARSKHAAARR